MAQAFLTAPALRALTSALAFAVAAVLLKRGLQYATPLAAVLVSVHFTAATVWILAAGTQTLSLALAPRVWPFLVAGLVAPGLARLGVYLGVHRVGASRAAALASCAPLFATVIAMLVLGEHPTLSLLGGTVAIVAGGVLLAYRHRDDRAWRRRDLVFPILGACGYAIRDNLSRMGLTDFPHPLVAAAVATASSVAVLWVVVLIAKRTTRRTGLIGVTGTGIRLLALCGLAEGLAYLTMWRALMLGTVSVVSPLVSSYSIFTVGLAWLFLRDLERVTWQIALAATFVVAGVGLIIGYGAG
jgi:uncharacterized membrane protein